MDNYLLYSLIILIVIIIGYICLTTIRTKENFETYSYEGSGFPYMDSGASPLSFYCYPAYRKPYMFPQVF